MPDLRSSAAPDIPTDWSGVDAICRRMAMLFDRSEPHFLYARDRERLDALFPIEHEDICWLGKNYRNQPDVWKYGCDRGCFARVARTR